MNLVRDFIRALQAERKATSPYDTTATVVRVDDKTAWVHISGGVDETPVRRTVDAKIGDEVQVRVGGGKAWITGNASSPPTDDTRAIKADTNATIAKNIADSAFNSAETAADAAGRAITSATQAANAAASAQTSANNAQTSANNAAEYASRALGGLSTVQSVSETLTWITQHGTMTLTTDVALDPTHVYFVRDNNGNYTVGSYRYSIVTEPDVDDISTYYELTIDESLNNYVGTHLALTDEGLWLLPASSSTNKVLIATGAGSVYTVAGTYLIDSSGSINASFRADGATIKGENDTMIAHLGYGPGQNTGGTTSDAPYYTLGTRASTTVGNYSLTEGRSNTASGYASHAEGGSNEATGSYAHAEGGYTYATGERSHAEGTSTFAEGYASHSEGQATHANGYNSHAEGNTCYALGDYSHAEGKDCHANGDYSHAQNFSTAASSDCQTSIGKYNVIDTADTYALLIGNGNSNARSNALTVDWSGNVNIASGAKYQINGTNLSASDVDAVPTSRTVNNKALSSNISLTASDVSAVPTSRTVNSKALSSNITISASDVSAVALSDKYTRSSAGDIQWTNQTDGDAKVMAKSGVAFWNGAYNGTSSNLKYSVNGEILGKTNVKDYVTATGSDGIWKYRKWSSGRIECWGEKSWSSVACTTSAGGGYRSADVTQALPSGLFTAIDSCQATMKGSGGSGYAMALRTLCTTTTVTQMFWNTSSATKTNLVVDYYIIGT